MAALPRESILSQVDVGKVGITLKNAESCLEERIPNVSMSLKHL